MQARTSVRALLISEQTHILLSRVRVNGPDKIVWIVPGGGLEPGETHLAGLEREVYEETGYRGALEAQLVWRGISEYVLNGVAVRQTDHFYWCRVKKFAAKPVYLEPGDEKNNFFEMRWWSLSELETSAEVFGPRQLAKHLSQLIEGGSPDEPIDLEPLLMT